MPSNIFHSFKTEDLRKLARILVDEYGADLLLSSGGYPGESCSFVGVNPYAEYVATMNDRVEELRAFAFSDDDPVAGFVSYDYGMALRGVQSRKYSCEEACPCVLLRKYNLVVEYDQAIERLEISSGDKTLLAEVSSIADSLPLKAGENGACIPRFARDWGYSLGRREYINGVKQVLEEIKNGNTYQLCLSTRISTCLQLDPAELFFSLQDSFPAPFYAFFRCGEKSYISTSPELFLRVEDGSVISKPIKGTLRFDKYSPELEQELRRSPKEDAELSMIVDLIRNDISCNCEYGSVKVRNHKSVFAVDNLLQMYSEVHGELRRDRDCLDLFFDAFPGGSVTGCPKKSSMEIIERLEPHSRGIYCGSFVLIRGPRDMVSSIAIRTAEYASSSGEFSYCAGSGIVIDSNPEAEYHETIAKAGKILGCESDWRKNGEG